MTAPNEPHMNEGNCSDALHELYEFIDGELTPERRKAIHSHLEDCPPCFEAFDFEAEIKGYLAQKCREHVPDSLKEKIARAIAQTEGSGE